MRLIDVDHLLYNPPFTIAGQLVQRYRPLREECGRRGGRRAHGLHLRPTHRRRGPGPASAAAGPQDDLPAASSATAPAADSPPAGALRSLPQAGNYSFRSSISFLLYLFCTFPINPLFSSAASPLIHEFDELVGRGHEPAALPSRCHGAHAVRQHGGSGCRKSVKLERLRSASASREPASARRTQTPVPRPRLSAPSQALGGPHQDVQAHQRGVLHEEEEEGAADAGRGGGGIHAL